MLQSWRAFNSLGLVIIIGAGIPGCYLAARIAWADWLSAQDSLPQRTEAVSMIPANAILWVRLAQKQQELGISATRSYTEAIECEPLNAKLWIGLGLEEELTGNYRLAEKDFLHAAALSREFMPLVTLAGFYFRRNAPAQFTLWARKALTMTPGDMDPESIFKMAWDLAGSEPQDDFLPERQDVLRAYLGWLLRSKPSNFPKRQANKLAKSASAADAPVLLIFCDRALDRGDFSTAADIWNALAGKHLIGGEQIPSRTGLQNSAFEWEPLKSGFDWVMPEPAGIRYQRSPRSLEISFSGDEPEMCSLLGQYVAVRPGQRYRLKYEYATSGVPTGGGLTWEAIANRTVVLASSLDLSSEQETTAYFPFAAPSNVSGVRLQLNYRRGLGTRRIEGWIRFRKVTLESAD